MNRPSLAGLASTLIAIALGCSDAQEQEVVQLPPLGGVAIIDLDRIAEALGQDQEMADSIRRRQQELQSQLNAWNRARRAELAASAGVQQASWHEDNAQALADAKRTAAGDLVQHRAALIQEFRESIRTTVRKIAAARGLTLVVTKNDAVVFDFAPPVDITDAVIKHLQP